MKIIISLCFQLIFFQGYTQSTDTVSIFSNSMHRNLKAVVITPDEYANPATNFPVVYLLHGYSGSYSNWPKHVPLLQKWSTENQMIIVCPDGGYSSWYADSKLNPANQYETFFARELIHFIDSAYRTKATSKFRGITGLSMGGHGALMLGMRHPDIFGSMASMSGAVNLLGFAGKYEMEQIFGDTATQITAWKKYSVLALADSFSTKKMPILIDCGVNDIFIEDNRSLHQKLLERKIPHTYIERAGVHNWDYWENALPDHLLFFRKIFTSNVSIN